MLFGKKEDKKKLPDLPSPKTNFNLNQTESMYDEPEEANALPSFPDSPSHNNFSQAAIKDAVGQSEQQEFPHSQQPAQPDFPYGQRRKTIEMKEWHPSIPEEPEEDKFSISDSLPEEYDEREIPSSIPSRIDLPTSEYQNPPVKKDVFVRIDKFNTAKRSLLKAKETLQQIDDLIKRIRETKLREDQEVSSWEHDILNIKSRINEVSENIFEKLE